MSLAAKWKNRAGVSASGGEVVRSIFPQSSKLGLREDFEDCGNIEHNILPLALGVAGGHSVLPWPEPEPFPLVVRSEPWKYACLFTIASVYGVVLTKEAKDGLTLSCSATIPPEAAQAARDGLAELTDYIGGRLPAKSRR